MSTIAASPNPCLVAILLIAQARTGSGAQVVFHYPPEPLSDNQQNIHSQEPDTAGIAASSSSDSESSSSDDDDFEIFAKRVRAEQSPRNHSSSDSGDEFHPKAEASHDDDGSWKPSWEPLLGFGEDGLVSLLAPGRAWHKRKFELGINDLTFLGRPVYAREDGLWRKKRSKRINNQHDDDPDQPSETPASETEPDDEETLNGNEPAQVNTKELHDTKPSKSQLTMFHVVFVVDPPPLEYAFRVKEMYDNVVRKFSRILKWEQAHHDYVWKQAELMQSIKSSHRSRRLPTSALYNETLKRSSLASALQAVYNAISTSRIAVVSLSQKVSISLQIPPVTSTSHLPSPNDPPIQPGLWLTTANDSPHSSSDLDHTSHSAAWQLAKSFTLLLKSTPQKILKDVHAAGGPLAQPLAKFMDKYKPTKSLYKISVASHLDLSDIQVLARHLIYWRRAIAIPPLHQRDTYIVSPNADMSKLADACAAYEYLFPMMPSLPKMLNILSGAPTHYGSIFPSTDHKEEYYKVLDWLMSRGWVTQLRTYAFIRVDPSIKKAVREDIDRDRKQQRHNSTFQQQEASSPTISGNDSPSSQRAAPRPSLVSQNSNSSDSTRNQLSSTRTASLIMSPLRASPEESKWLDAIADSIFNSPDLSDDDKALLQTHWPQFIKYFNGAEPLEKIAVREGLKRKVVWDLLANVGLTLDRGVEDDKGENKDFLVTVRHW